MATTVTLGIEHKDMSLVLREDDSIISQDQWVDVNNLLEEFFPRFRSLLESNSLCVEDIEDFVLETELPTGLTTVRIAGTIVRTLNFAAKS